LHSGPYSISSPHHSFLKTNLFDTIRVGTYNHIYKNNDENKIYNKLDTVNFKEIYSCDLMYFGLKRIIDYFEDNIWLVLSYHSLDGEGFCPVSSEELLEIKDMFLRKDYEIKTVGEVFKQCNKCHS